MENKKIICIACDVVADNVTAFQDHCMFGHEGCNGAEIYDATMAAKIKDEMNFSKAGFSFYG